jgi:hypothetical protein
MDAAAWSSLPLPLLLSVSIVDASVLVSDKEYTDLSGLGALARFTKPEQPSSRFFLASLDLRLLTGMVLGKWGDRGVEEHTIVLVLSL